MMIEIHESNGEVFAVTLDDEIWRELQELAEAQAVSPAVCVRQAIRVYLNLDGESVEELRLR